MLKDRGVPSEVLAAMLKHGGEMRARAMAAAPAPPSSPDQQYPNAAAPYPENPDYGYSSPTSYPDYGYASSPYYYNYSSYPYYPYYGYSYPWYWPSFYLGYPYYYNHFHAFHSVNHFAHGNHLTAFHGNFNGRATTLPSHGGGFRAVGSGGHAMAVGAHVGMSRGGFSGGGGFHGGGGFTAHAGGGFGGHGGGGGRR